jgi:translation elongation factor EF-Tu-like GTPase
MSIFDKFANKNRETNISASKIQDDDKNGYLLPFSMRIDDVFSIAGRGIVVIGKIDTGSIKLNEEIITTGETQKKKVIIASIEVRNKLTDRAKAGDVAGLLLKNITENEVTKGYMIVQDGENYVLRIGFRMEQP